MVLLMQLMAEQVLTSQDWLEFMFVLGVVLITALTLSTWLDNLLSMDTMS